MLSMAHGSEDSAGKQATIKLISVLDTIDRSNVSLNLASESLAYKIYSIVIGVPLLACAIVALSTLSLFSVGTD